MLSERKAAILQAVVEGYISTSEPMGSAQIVQAAELDVSSATVRTEMASLEEEGFLHQPHTSAGRVPSDKGYRYFVDTLMEPATLGRNQQQKVSSFFDAAQGELEQLLRATSGFLAQLTDHAALVVGPPVETSPVRAVQLVRLASDQVMAVLVRGNGVITKRTLIIDADATEDVIEDAGRRLVAIWVAGAPDPGAEVAGSDAVVDAVQGAVDQPDESPVFVGGTSSVARIFEAVDQVQEVLEVLEKQYLVVTLVRDVIERGLEVAIGSETGVEPLADCSLIVTPIEVDGVRAGSVGLLGPTRMNYSRMMATVALVGQQLSSHLREGGT